jgi:hypothetical protein
MSYEAVKIDAGCHTAYVLRRVYHFEHRDYVKMEEFFVKALEVVEDPENSYTGQWPSWMMVTLIDGMVANEGKVDEGIIEKVSEKQFEAYLRRDRKRMDVNPEFKTLKQIAKALCKNGRPEEALGEIDRYLINHPYDKKAMRYREKIEKSID